MAKHNSSTQNERKQNRTKQCKKKKKSIDRCVLSKSEASQLSHTHTHPRGKIRTFVAVVIIVHCVSDMKTQRNKNSVQ